MASSQTAYTWNNSNVEKLKKVPSCNVGKSDKQKQFESPTDESLCTIEEDNSLPKSDPKKATAIEDFDAKIRDLLGEYESLTDDEIDQFAYKASLTGNVHNTLPAPTKEDIKKIFKDSFDK